MIKTTLYPTSTNSDRLKEDELILSPDLNYDANIMAAGICLYSLNLRGQPQLFQLYAYARFAASALFILVPPDVSSGRFALGGTILQFLEIQLT